MAAELLESLSHLGYLAGFHRHNHNDRVSARDGLESLGVDILYGAVWQHIIQELEACKGH